MASKSIDIVVNAKDNASGVFNGIAKLQATFVKQMISDMEQ